jgi:ectoine hydroxylase-related dioxygenase (phytanoyl-CoA dioxygenase family)
MLPKTRKPLEFEPSTMPWLDRMLREIDTYIASVESDPAARYELRGQLLHFMQFGYVKLPNAIDHRLIDAYLADVYDLFDQRCLNVPISSDYNAYAPVRDYPDKDYYKHGLRIIDFHNSSIAAKKLSMHAKIVGFLSHVFREQVVVMQSLTFMKSTQQDIHQDFAYVVADIPSHLAAAWVALEDIDPKSGPLSYYPGSHTNPIFDWGNGMFRTADSTRNDREFAEHIHAQCKAAGQPLEQFAPRKGDVFIWHGSLAHGGSLAIDQKLTRKSYVTHYSTLPAFKHDYRAKDREPYAYDYNGGLIYRHPHRPEEEDYYKRGLNH